MKRLRHGKVGAGRSSALKAAGGMLLILCLLAPTLAGRPVLADDRYDLGKVIRSMPPNGPFWQYGNVVMRWQSRQAGMAPVVFPHWRHRAYFTCRVCHLELDFAMRAGETGIRRSQYTKGRYCGVCHDGRTAFTVQGDPGSPNCDRCHLKDTAKLEKSFDTFSEGFPVASFGNGIDWGAAIRNGMISPVNSLNPRFSLKFPEKLRAPIRLGTASPRSDVTFSHQDHFAELDCSSCHPDIFTIKRKGTESFSMDRNMYGNFCGACHLLVAFPMSDCKRCHPYMNGGGN